MAEVLVAPDVPLLIIELLRAGLVAPEGELPAVVSRTVPNPRPDRHITVRLVPGAGRSTSNPVIDRQMITVEAWAQTPGKAADLAQDARALVHAAKGVVVGGMQVYQVQEISGPGELPDPLSEQPRVTFTVQLTVRLRRRT